MGLMIPIRNQLSAVVFSKTMRKKDVKGLQKESEKSNQESINTDEEEDELQNMKQGAINLLAVDSDRVALFCAMSNIFVESFFGTLFGFVFIIIILGFVLPSHPIYREMLTRLSQLAELDCRSAGDSSYDPHQYLFLEEIFQGAR
jgi:hypothetical protein